MNVHTRATGKDVFLITSVIYQGPVGTIAFDAHSRVDAKVPSKKHV